MVKHMAMDLHISKKMDGFQLEADLETPERRIGILGASGCGKSMLLKSIAGIEKPDSGRIAADGRVMFDSVRKLNLAPRHRRVGYLFQNYALFPTMTVVQNIACGLGDCRKEKVRAVCKEMVSRFALEGLEKRYPAELSGGQQQRVALARIMAYEPELIMLDEPFAALDSHLKDQMKQELKEMLAGYKGTMILVSHSRDEVYEFCEHLVVMDAGRIIEAGRTKQVFARPNRMETARLTGCKNISPAVKTGEHQVLAVDFGITLHTKEKVSDRIRYVGFRAHDIQPALKGEENSFPCFVESCSEEPFEVKYLLRAACEAKAAVWWKVSRLQQKNSFQNCMPERVRIPGESLFLLED